MPKSCPVLLLLLFHCLLAQSGAIAADSSLRATALRCESLAEPLGIDIPQPRLSWQVQSAERGQKQTAYQILVASNAEKLTHNEGDLWDSGRVASAQTLRVAYSGKNLASSQQAFWKVRVWDRNAKPVDWSGPASWTMGILQAADWHGAQWIIAPGATESLLLRHTFLVRPGLRRAVAHVCGLGQYELSFNGAKAGNDFLSPGWTAYDHTVLYDTRDVTSLLREGKNAAGMVLGNGMYNVVRRDRFVKFAGSFGPLRAMLLLRLEYTDGSVQFVTTDTQWRCHAGPITFNNIYGGEDYDARLEQKDWDQPGFEDSRWEQAAVLIRPAGVLQGLSASAPPLRVIEAHPFVASRTLPDGSVVYDLGQNASHIPRIRVAGLVGSRVRLTPAEIVREDGSIDTATMGGSDRGGRWWQYTKGTNGTETWTPRFCYVGCRYLKAEFLPATTNGPMPKLESLEGCVVHSVAAPASQFETSNPLLNRIRTLVRWAQRSNMVSVLTDCPHREKLGWLEQYHLNGPALRYEWDADTIFAKGEHDMADAQTEDGLVPTTAPEYAKFKGTFRAAAEWSASFILVPWQQYQFTGDLDLLRANFEAMKRYFAYLQTRATDDILSEGLGDWYDLGPKKAGVAQLTPPPVTATAFYYQDAAILAQAAVLLGRADDARAFTDHASRIRASYNRHFFHADSGTYATGSQCANAIPLVMGLVEPAEQGRVEAALVRDVEAHDCAMTTGDVGFRYLLLALAQAGRSDLIYRMVNQDTRPGYGYQLKQGETSLTEAWDANRTSSHNHFMLGQVTEWFYKDLAGIDSDPAASGFENIVLRPAPVGDLKWVSARYESIRGPIAVRWEREGNRFRIKAEIPANTTATLYLPANPGATVLESKRPAVQQAGVKYLRTEGDRSVFALESGSYDFTSTWEARRP